MNDINQNTLNKTETKISESNTNAASDAPIRVLHVFGRVGLGGAESRIMDLYRNIDKSRIQFDFLVHYSAKKTGKKAPSSKELMEVREPDFYDEEIKKLGGNIYVVPRFEGTNYFAYKKALNNLFRENKGRWNVVHGHMTSTAAIYLPIAKKTGKAGITVAHSRNAGTEPGIKGLATKLFRLPLKKAGTGDFYFTCSEIAGRAVFGDKLYDQGMVRTIPNAIDVEKFSFNTETRTRIRKELGVDDDTILLGHVGRFDYQKNHEYLIKVFASLMNIKSQKAPETKFKLVLIGKGSLMDTVKKQVKELGISEDVMFLGLKGNAKDYYSAMDMFVFPSFYEGLPGTVVEAQAAGLKSLISDTITTEVDITDLVCRMSIQDSPDTWADKILDTINTTQNRQEEAYKYAKELSDAGFDARTQGQVMSYFYQHGTFEDNL